MMVFNEGTEIYVDTRGESFESYRPLLFSIAYRMLGTVMDAEDIVQEAYLRYQKSDLDAIQSHKAFLTTITTRLCLDYLKSARVQRESYPGTWLPEPVVTENAPQEIVGKRDMISMAFLVLLESLTPLERAIFLLRDVFDYPYREIARIVDKSEANCRQYYRKAKAHLDERQPINAVKPVRQNELVARFVQAVATGDLDGLNQVLARDVVIYSDGGGKVTSAPYPILGREKVTRVFMSGRRLYPENITHRAVEMNGGIAILVYAGDHLINATTFSGDDERIHAIHIVWNPDKIGHLKGLIAG